jgi:hypothetical protein
MKKLFILFSALLLSISLIARDPGPGEIDDLGLEDLVSVGADVGRFVAEHDIVLVGADNIAVERDPGQTTDLPLHKIVLRDLGGYLVELLDLSAPAADGVTSGMLVLAPLRIHRGVNSPVNPLLVA